VQHWRQLRQPLLFLRRLLSLLVLRMRLVLRLLLQGWPAGHTHYWTYSLGRLWQVVPVCWPAAVSVARALCWLHLAARQRHCAEGSAQQVKRVCCCWLCASSHLHLWLLQLVLLMAASALQQDQQEALRLAAVP
jgi:hypothetical protein